MSRSAEPLPRCARRRRFVLVPSHTSQAGKVPDPSRASSSENRPAYERRFRIERWQFPPRSRRGTCDRAGTPTISTPLRKALRRRLPAPGDASLASPPRSSPSPRVISACDTSTNCPQPVCPVVAVDGNRKHWLDALTRRASACHDADHSRRTASSPDPLGRRRPAM